MSHGPGANAGSAFPGKALGPPAGQPRPNRARPWEKCARIAAQRGGAFSSLVALSRQVSPGVIGLLISAQPARSTRPSTAQRGLMRDKSELRERNDPAHAGLLRRGQGESIPHLSPSPESASILPSPAAREGARMITGIVRGLWGGVRGASPSGGGAARTVLACRAASHNGGVRNQRRPVPATALPSG